MILHNWMDGDMEKCYKQATLSAQQHLPFLIKSLSETGRGAGPSMLILQRLTEKLTDLWKVIQTVIGQDQNRTGIYWPPCLSTAKMIQRQEKQLLNYKVTQSFDCLFLVQDEFRHLCRLTFPLDIQRKGYSVGRKNWMPRI